VNSFRIASRHCCSPHNPRPPPPAALLTLQKAIAAHRDRQKPELPAFVAGEMHGGIAMRAHELSSLVAASAATCTLSILTIVALGSSTRPGLVQRCRLLALPRALDALHGYPPS
jgi:hypothetical protein